jgi:hypothetical protein
MTPNQSKVVEIIAAALEAPPMTELDRLQRLAELQGCTQRRDLFTPAKSAEADE